jgi:hypothetical protein
MIKTEVDHMPKGRAIVWRRSTVRANTLAIQWDYTAGLTYASAAPFSLELDHLPLYPY